VLEARDRVGGRTHTRRLGDGAFDVGGQWLGPGQHRLAALAERLGAATFPTFHDGAKLLDDGRRVSRYTGTIPSLNPLELAQLQLALHRLDRLTQAVSARDPLAGPGAAELDRRTVAEEARRIRSSRVRGLLEVAIGTVFGVEPHELSLLWFLAYLRAGGGLMKLCEIEGGAQERRFVDGAGALATRWAADQGDVVTAAPVRRIEQRGAGPATELVLTTDRGRLAATAAVLAVPPPLAARIDLEPSPGWRDQLLQRHAMGAIVKLVLAYERPFWRERGLSGEVVALGGGPISTVFDNCSHDLRQPSLVAFVQAGAARRWRGAADLEAALAQLARYFGDEARRPVDTAAMDWTAEPYSRGCPVAVAGPGSMAGFAATLRQPVGRVWFAGTETAVEWTGYIEGALESGERAAREVVRAL
jgi:monoamine oxidase